MDFTTFLATEIEKAKNTPLSDYRGYDWWQITEAEAEAFDIDIERFPFSSLSSTPGKTSWKSLKPTDLAAMDYSLAGFHASPRRTPALVTARLRRYLPSTDSGGCEPAKSPIRTKPGKRSRGGTFDPGTREHSSAHPAQRGFGVPGAIIFTANGVFRPAAETYPPCLASRIAYRGNLSITGFSPRGFSSPSHAVWNHNFFNPSRGLTRH